MDTQIIMNAPIIVGALTFMAVTAVGMISLPFVVNAREKKARIRLEKDNAVRKANRELEKIFAIKKTNPNTDEKRNVQSKRDFLAEHVIPKIKYDKEGNIEIANTIKTETLMDMWGDGMGESDPKAQIIDEPPFQISKKPYRKITNINL